MSRLRAIIIGALLLLGSLCAISVPSVYAVDVITQVCDGQNGIEQSQVCTDNLTNSDSNPLFGESGILTKAINIISIIVAIVAVIIIIIAGLKFITSQGNAQSINTARNQIIYAIIGIIVAALAQGLVALVLRRI
jgi:hypothetical protein